jgi:predicted AlkP superfamily pyrophosphatase or phosphodiesterase
MSTTLPAKPKALGNLRHVFKSSLAAIGFQPDDNPLKFKRNKSVTVVFIDGLGTHQIKERAGHSRWLAAQSGSGYSVFPSTTACGITSFATGVWPGEHGIVGHQAFDRHLNLGGNMLTGWGGALVPRVWQTVEPLSFLASAAGVSVRVIAHPEYEKTGFTEITMAGAQFHSAETTSSRFDLALQLAQPGVNYLYIAELDKLAHRFGWQSEEWAAAYERIARELERFVSQRADMAVVVTSDHGLMDTARDRLVFLEQPLMDIGLDFVGGDTRVCYLYLTTPEQTEAATAALSSLSRALSVHSVSEFVQAGWFGPVLPAVSSRLPDMVLIARSNYTLFHERFAKPKSSEMVAHHGGMTPAEIQIPILRFGI